MSRAAAPERRVKLLDQIVDYIMSHGLAGLSLRPLAAGVNTSPRMLLYFFGSKERLISEALAQIRVRQRADFARAMVGPGERRERLMRAWRTWSSPKMGQFWRFCFGVYGYALQNPAQFAEFLERFVGEWLPPLDQALGAAGFSRRRARSLATLSLGAMRGLQLDLLATGDRARIDEAFREMLRLLNAASRETGGNARRVVENISRKTAAAMPRGSGWTDIAGGLAGPKSRRRRRLGDKA